MSACEGGGGGIGGDISVVCVIAGCRCRWETDDAREGRFRGYGTGVGADRVPGGQGPASAGMAGVGT